MKKKIIFLTIESVKRELNSRSLLALKALKRNYRVVIGQKGSLREFVKDTNPGIILLKSFGWKNTVHIDFVKKKKFKIASSDEELITAIDYEEKINFRMNNENLDKLDLLLATGETSDFPVINKNFKSRIKNVLVCGNIRLELLKKKYRKLMEKDAELIKNKFGDYILLLTAFPKVNKEVPSYMIDSMFYNIVEYNLDPESKWVNILNDHVKLARDSLIQTLKFLNNFEKNFPDKKLVISPHPNEKIDFWKRYIFKRKFKNIFLNTDMHSPSHPLIFASDIIISSNSTTILEAYFLEKKVINLLGKKERISEIDLLKKISKVTRSSEELLEVLKDPKVIISKSSLNQQIKEIKNLEENFDSFDAMLDRFDEFNDVKFYDSLFANYFNLLLSKLRMLKNIIKKNISYTLNLNPLIKRLNKEKIGTRMNKKNFIKNLRKLNDFEKVENLYIKQVAPQVYLLDKR